MHAVVLLVPAEGQSVLEGPALMSPVSDQRSITGQMLQHEFGPVQITFPTFQGL